MSFNFLFFLFFHDLYSLHSHTTVEKKTYISYFIVIYSYIPVHAVNRQPLVFPRNVPSRSTFHSGMIFIDHHNNL